MWLRCIDDEPGVNLAVGAGAPRLEGWRMSGVDLAEQILGRVTIRVVNGAGGDGYAIAKASLRRYQRIVVNFISQISPSKMGR